MKKERNKFQEKDKKLKTTATFSVNRKKQLKPTFIWWGWKTV